jgi:hypothetical protein
MAKLKSIPSAEKVKTVHTFTAETPACSLGMCRANVLNVPAGVRSVDALSAAHALLIATKHIAFDCAMGDEETASSGDEALFAVSYMAEIAAALVEAVVDGSDTPPEVQNG